MINPSSTGVYIDHDGEADSSPLLKYPCFRRFKARDIMSAGWDDDNEPQWVDLHEDPAHNMLTDNQFPGSLHMRIGFGPSSEAEGKQWGISPAILRAKEETVKYDVRVFLFKGCSLESSDPGNMLDAYVLANWMGREQKSPIKYQTREPEWFHTFRCV